MTVSKFKVGDKVYAPYRGYGTVTAIHSGTAYPIEVTWDECECADLAVSTFTKDGCLSQYFDNDDTILTVVEKASLKGEKEMEEDSKFQVGDRVYAPFRKYGTIVEIVDTDASYPITVRWDESRYKLGGDLSTFTEDGYLFFGDKTENTKITKIEGEKMGQISGVIQHSKSDDEAKDITPLDVIDLSKDDGVADRMMDALDKKTDDAINPSHYQVAGIPEAYDIMMHLMKREQLEGFFWGNIIKYAYRYGRKGDKAETAGKIKWYAQKLKELGECVSK